MSILSKRLIYGGYGYGYGNGLSTGARIGIGIGAAVCFVIAILLFTRVARRRRAAQQAAYTYGQQNPSSLPTTQPQMAYPPAQSYNNNNSYYGQQPPNATDYNQSYSAPAGAPPIKAPQQAYQPSMAGQYGGNGTGNGNGNGSTPAAQTESHDYEYQQAQENSRLEALERNGQQQNNEDLGGALPPPAYGEAPVAGQKHYPAPSGPPPRTVDPTNIA